MNTPLTMENYKKCVKQKKFHLFIALFLTKSALRCSRILSNINQHLNLASERYYQNLWTWSVCWCDGFPRMFTVAFDRLF